MHSSIALPGTVEFINIEPSKFSPLISKCQIKVCYVGDTPNRNGSIITKEVAKEMAPSLRGCPIAGFYNTTKEDFEGHNSIIDISNGNFKIVDTTTPYGFVDLNAEVWFQKFLDDNETEHEYMVTNGWLWTELYEGAKRIIEKGNNKSMELSDEDITAPDDCQFFIINSALISKLCILGEDVEPCFEGASIGPTTFSLDIKYEFMEKLEAMMKEFRQYMTEGGMNAVPENEVINAPDALEQEEFALEPEAAPEEVNEETENFSIPQDQADKTICAENEDTIEAESQTYSLEEIPEYVELKSTYESLKKEYEALKEQKEALDTQVSSLLDFKNKAERKDKEAKIAEFWMLSDTDKEDVLKNIDKYSIDDIESKLAVICFRNKVSLSEEEPAKANITTFNLNSTDDSMPAWVRSALETEKNLK